MDVCNHCNTHTHTQSHLAKVILKHFFLTGFHYIAQAGLESQYSGSRVQNATTLTGYKITL